MRSLVRGGVFLALALAAAGPAHAAGQWLPPQDITPTAGLVTTPSVATDALGSVFAVWGGHEEVLSASRPATAGAWEAPQPISSTGGVEPQLAVTEAGTAIAVWLRFGLVEAAVRPPGGAWEPAQTISDLQDSAQSPQVAVDRAGNAFAVWGRARGGEMSIQASFRPVETGMWGSPEPVTTPPSTDYGPVLAVGANGDAIVVWTLPDGYLMSSFRRAEAHVWGSPQTIAAGGGFTANGYASVGLDDAGNAVVVFDHREGFNAGVVASRRLVSAGSWEPWIPIGEGSNQSTAIAIDQPGNAIAIWQGGGSQSIIQAATLPFGGSWGAAETVSQGITHRWPAIALDDAGDAFAVWQRTTQPPPPPPYPIRHGGLEYAARAAIRPAGGPWQPSQDVSLPGVDADDIGVAADPAGNGIAVWRRPGGFVQVAAYDGAGPLLDELSIPDAGEPGVPVSFSVSPFDVWSDVDGEASWSFGDGATATGNQVSHVYAAGSYVVSVRADDTLGNRTTESESILIGQAPPPPPEPVPPPLPPPTQPPPPSGTCRVPRVIGKKLPAARSAIRRAHCAVGRVRRARSRRAKGRVVGQSPRAGRRVKAARASTSSSAAAADHMWCDRATVRHANGGIAALAVVAALFLVAPAHAVRGWHPPFLIGTDGNQPKIALNAGGTAAVAWIGSGSVQAAIRTLGTWSAPQDLGAGAYVPPDVAVDGSGNVVVVWEGPDYVVHAAVKPGGGAWLPSQAISAPGIGWPLGAHVEFAGDGSATAIWYRPVGYGDLRIETSVRPASSGEWQPSVEIGRGANPDIAVQPDGSAVAVWSARPGDYAIQAAVRGSDGIWEPPATLSGPAYVFGVYPRVAVDGAGNATALWSRMRQDQVMALESASRPFGSAGWQPPDTIATGRVYGYFQGISHAGLAISPAGNLVTAWEQWDGNSWVRAAYRVPGGSWPTPQDLSQRSENLDPVVAANLAGDALVLWSRAASSRLDALIQVSFRDAATEDLDRSDVDFRERRQLSRCRLRRLGERGRGLGPLRRGRPLPHRGGSVRGRRGTTATGPSARPGSAATGPTAV